MRLGEIKLVSDPNEGRATRHADVRRFIALALTRTKETAEAKPLTAQLLQQAEGIVNANEMTPEAFAKARSLLEVARDAYPYDATASPVGRLRRAIERAVEAIQRAEAGLKLKAPPVAPPSVPLGATSSVAPPTVSYPAPSPAGLAVPAASGVAVAPVLPAEPIAGIADPVPSLKPSGLGPLHDANMGLQVAWFYVCKTPDPRALAQQLVSKAWRTMNAKPAPGRSNFARARIDLEDAIEAYEGLPFGAKYARVFDAIRAAIQLLQRLDAQPGAVTDADYEKLAAQDKAATTAAVPATDATNPPRVPVTPPPADPLAALPRTLEGTIGFVELTPGGLDIPEAMELIAAWYKPLAVRIVPAARDRLLLIDIHGDQEKTARALVEAASALKKQGKFGPAEKAKILAEPGLLTPKAPPAPKP